MGSLTKESPYRDVGAFLFYDYDTLCLHLYTIHGVSIKLSYRNTYINFYFLTKSGHLFKYSINFSPNPSFVRCSFETGIAIGLKSGCSITNFGKL